MYITNNSCIKLLPSERNHNPTPRLNIFRTLIGERIRKAPGKRQWQYDINIFFHYEDKDNANREQNKMNPFIFYAKMQFISALEQRYKAEKRMKSELKGSIDYFKQKRGLTQIYTD